MRTFKTLLAGDTGTGKTAQFETMPEPRYAHIFDPAALNTLSLRDDQYETFFPSPDDLNLVPTTAQADKRKPSKDGPQLYVRWATRFSDQVHSGAFDSVASFMLDSATLMGLAALQRQRWLGDRDGRKDERQDHRFAGAIVTEALWLIASLPCHVLITMHTRPVEEKVGEAKTGRTTNKLTIPGGSQLMLPRLVSACWYTKLLEDRTKGPRYMAMTRPQAAWPNVRTPRGWDVELWHDMTIEDWTHPERYGIGKLIKEASA